MARKPSHRGVGSNQHQDKPQNRPTVEETAYLQQRSAGVASAIQQAAGVVDKLQSKAKQEHSTEMRQQEKERRKQEREQRKQQRKEERNLRKEIRFTRSSGENTIRSVEKTLKNEMGLDSSDWEWATDYINVSAANRHSVNHRSAEYLGHTLGEKTEVAKEDLPLIMGAEKQAHKETRDATKTLTLSRYSEERGRLYESFSPPIRLQSGHVIVLDLKGGESDWKKGYVDARELNHTAQSSGYVLCAENPDGTGAKKVAFSSAGELATAISANPPSSLGSDEIYWSSNSGFVSEKQLTQNSRVNFNQTTLSKAIARTKDISLTADVPKPPQNQRAMRGLRGLARGR